jgi:glutamate synthase (NADPH/NADH) small chain
MGKPTGFLEFERELPDRRPVAERLRDFREVYQPFPTEKSRLQAARCMDCGVPFCQSGCPLGNIIPDWNDLVHEDRWEEAYRRLSSTNNFPEFTGRICPAPCESACVLGLVDQPVTIEHIERTIAEVAFENGWVQPRPPAVRTGKRIAVVGSGPAGLAAADQLNRAGHLVTVLEREDRIGGLLRYGIPDFKLEKWVIDRRVGVMKQEGVVFKTSQHVAVDFPAEDLSEFDAVVLCCGATRPRDLDVPGRGLIGVHFAWDYLSKQNRMVSGDGGLAGLTAAPIDAAGKNVVVIGGGDTGSDCVGTANRQGAASVTQFELLPTPPDERPDHQPWPYYPMVLRTSTSHEEGADRHWSLMTKAFQGSAGNVERVLTVSVERAGDGRFIEIAGSERSYAAELVLLAIGYSGPETGGIVDALGVTLSDRGTVATDSGYRTNVPGVYSAGDMRRGQSLVVWAISEGREAARRVDAWLMNRVALPTKGEGDLPRV